MILHNLAGLGNDRAVNIASICYCFIFMWVKSLYFFVLSKDSDLSKAFKSHLKILLSLLLKVIQ